jgi:phosphate acyltransferase
MKVALDGMGGDHAPDVPVDAALAALDELGNDLSIILTGPENVLRAKLADRGRANEPRIEIADASQVITMSDKAVKAIRQKRNSSLMRAVELHRDGKAQAVVSAGHTGALMAASYMMLGLIEGVRRPTVGSLLPIGGGRFSILLDVGANTDCKAVHLLEFGIMGTAFMEIYAGLSQPRVALLSIGEEKTKGNELVLAAHYLFEQSGLNFIGNLEGGDLLSGKADVLVCDGFTGNMLLKFAESVGAMLLKQLQDVCGTDRDLLGKFALAGKQFDYAEVGGSPLLGVNGISVICHGRSSAKAIKNAIREAIIMQRGNLAAALSAGVSKYDAGMFSRGMARWRSFREGRDQLDIEDDSHE